MREKPTEMDGHVNKVSSLQYRRPYTTDTLTIKPLVMTSFIEGPNVFAIVFEKTGIKFHPYF